MSGHSKWHSIKHKKGAADAKRGKIFTKHAKIITIVARDGGGDPDMNPGLRSAIANAKADNVPNANIDKAVKKGAGGDKDGVQYMEALYEGHGPAGTTVMIEAITDNKNRSVSNIKIAMTKNGGNLGSSGAVAWMFDRKGVILAKMGDKDADDAELEAIDAGAEDLEIEAGLMEITTARNDLMSVRDKLEQAEFEIEKAELAYLPKEMLMIDDVAKAEKILRLIDALEDDDDVSKVHGNFDISEEVLSQLS
jgi:YebC/PmpR family DNA-binding regulatory protein